jgi:hypothetical protein
MIVSVFLILGRNPSCSLGGLCVLSTDSSCRLRHSLEEVLAGRAFSFYFDGGACKSSPLSPILVPQIALYTWCPITHGIHCIKSVKTKCQFYKRLGGKKSEIQCKKLHFKRVQTKSEYIRHLEDERSSIGGSPIFLGGRWSELGPVKYWLKSLHK